ncbi:hypothetical protein [Bauldia sp.]|uniref:hypothetical protein n=1 Tax=Bauldia sp. TaxID=2575872 RepID=UPI003BAD0628
MAEGTSDDFRGLGWAHGCLTVQRLGAMLAPVTFLLPGGRQVSPMHIAPWADEPGGGDLPGILRRLRGEWPCVPFGYTVPADGFTPEWAAQIKPGAPDEAPHGHASNAEWEWTEVGPTEIRLGLDYPGSSLVARVERTVTPDPDAPAIDLTFQIAVREDCRLPIGLHPVFRLPSAVGGARLEPGAFSDGHTYPGTVEPEAPLFARDREFDSLTAVPGRDGGAIDASLLPLEADTEELLQLDGIDGTAALANEAEGYRVRLSWQKEHFPSLLLWYSNRGRQMAPWNGRHVAIGVEPICSPFGLGPATALSDNPIARSGVATAIAIRKDDPLVTRYRIAVEPL